VRYTLPGSIQVGGHVLRAGKFKQESGIDVTPQGPLDLWAAGVAQALFDWQSRGAIRAELEVRRGVTDARIGDVLTLDLAYFPSANAAQSPVSQRGTDARRAVILKRTVKPDRVSFLLEDRGLADTLACAPEFTLSADATSPKTTVSVEVTNEDDMVDHWVRVEMAVGASEPAGAGQLVRLWSPQQFDNPFTLPPVCAGNVVWVRMRCELDGQVGAWGAWEPRPRGPDPPSDLSAVVNNTSILLTWTNHETLPVEVLARLDADTTLQSVTVLPAGSTSYTLLLTQAETDYVVGVRYIDPKGCTSSTTTVWVRRPTWRSASSRPPPRRVRGWRGHLRRRADRHRGAGWRRHLGRRRDRGGSGVAGHVHPLVDTVVALLSPLRTRWTVRARRRTTGSSGSSRPSRARPATPPAASPPW
jgi:hypothetical protein